MTDAQRQGTQDTDPAAELAVLFPDVDVEVTDPDTGELVTLTVREFRFREGLEVTVLARPLVASLTGLAMAFRGDPDEGPEDDPDDVPDGDPGDNLNDGPDAGEFAAIFSIHADLWLDLIARACGRDADWIGRLGDEDAYALTVAMWEANGPFFLRRIVENGAAETGLAGVFGSATPGSLKSSAA